MSFHHLYYQQGVSVGKPPSIPIHYRLTTLEEEKYVYVTFFAKVVLYLVYAFTSLSQGRVQWTFLHNPHLSQTDTNRTNNMYGLG